MPRIKIADASIKIDSVVEDFVQSHDLTSNDDVGREEHLMRGANLLAYLVTTLNPDSSPTVSVEKPFTEEVLVSRPDAMGYFKFGGLDTPTLEETLVIDRSVVLSRPNIIGCERYFGDGYLLIAASSLARVVNDGLCTLGVKTNTESSHPSPVPALAGN